MFKIKDNAVTPVVRVCPGCSEVLRVTVRVKDLDDWKNGRKRADMAFPNLSDEELIWLVTNHCPKHYEEAVSLFYPPFVEE